MGIDGNIWTNVVKPALFDLDLAHGFVEHVIIHMRGADDDAFLWMDAIDDDMNMIVIRVAVDAPNRFAFVHAKRFQCMRNSRFGLRFGRVLAFLP